MAHRLRVSAGSCADHDCRGEEVRKRGTSMKPGEELAVLRQFLEALESGSMTIRESGKDVTQREIDKLKPDIAYLEKVLARKP